MKSKKNYIVFCDIHGCYAAARRAVHLAQEIKETGVFLGDYVDRGPSGCRVLQILRDAKKRNPDWVFLRGNHDQMLIDLIEGTHKTTDIGSAFNGEIEFSYSQTRKSFEEYLSLSRTEKKQIYNFLLETKFYHETDRIIFVHGILIDNGLLLEEKPEEEFIRSYGFENRSWIGKPFIHGHLPTDEIVTAGRATNINTQCGYGGILTGLLVDSEGNAIHNYSITESGKLFGLRH